MALTQISTAGVKDDAMTAGKIPANAVGSSELADNAVDTAALAADAVTGAKIADDAISADHYAAGSVNTTALGTDCVTGAKVADDALSADHYSAGSVNTTALGTNAVTTAKIANSAVTSAKLAASSVDSNALGSQAVVTANIADQAVTLAKLPHGDGSSNGKFLRANNGADPSFETVSIPAGTTINNNADNRLITGSGTANTLNGESGFTYNGSLLHINSGSSGLPKIRLQHSGAGNDVFEITSGLTGVSNGGFGIYDVDASAYRLAINSSGDVGIGTSSPGSFSNYKVLTIQGGTSGSGIDLKKSDGNIYGRLFADADGLQIQSHQSGDSIRFETNGGTVRARVTSDGLCFGSDTAAANALSDYEVGTFTPSWTFGPNQASGVSYSYRGGNYIKIGNFVYISIAITLSNKGTVSGAGYASVAGLPFNVVGDGGGAAVGYYDNFGSYNPSILRITQSEAIYVAQHNSGGYSQDLQHTHMNNSTNLYLTGSYQTND